MCEVLACIAPLGGLRRSDSWTVFLMLMVAGLMNLFSMGRVLVRDGVTVVKSEHSNRRRIHIVARGDSRRNF